MTGRGELAVLGVLAACCAGNALLLTGLLAAGGALAANPWVVAAAVAVPAVGIRQATVLPRRPGGGS